MAERNDNIPRLTLDPFPRYRAMRASNPVFFNEKTEWWEIYGYNDVQRVINDYTTFSSELVAAKVKRSLSILRMDPPRHRQLRALITQAFTPRTVELLAPRIVSIVNEHLDAVAATGQMDAVRDLAGPVPVIVIAEVLGIPKEEHPRFKRWSDAFVNFAHEESKLAVKEMVVYFREIVAHLRSHPEVSAENLISGLVAAQVDGNHLTETEIVEFCILLLTAGTETTTNLLGNALICFDEHPEVMEQLRQDLSLLPGAIEEVLRYRSPFQLVLRVATADVELGGKQIRAGQMVVPCIGSANRDEAQFSNPETFDIRRAPNRHLAFGHSIHFCLGAPMARLEGKIVLQILLERFHHIARVRDIPLEPLTSPTAYGVRHLPLTFEAVRAAAR